MLFSITELKNLYIREMADYVLPQKLRDSFAALYVTTDSLPYVLDIKVSSEKEWHPSGLSL